VQEEAAAIAAQVAGLKDAGSEDVLEAKRRVAEASAELDTARMCAAAACCSQFACCQNFRVPADCPAARGSMCARCVKACEVLCMQECRHLVAWRSGTWLLCQ
jgi:hypothetical protein